MRVLKVLHPPLFLADDKIFKKPDLDSTNYQDSQNDELYTEIIKWQQFYIYLLEKNININGVTNSYSLKEPNKYYHIDKLV